MRLLLTLCLGLVLLAPAAADTEKKSLYERLGGPYAIAALTDDFVDRLLSDDVIVANEKVVAALQPRPYNKIPGLKFHIATMLCQLTGGPERYSGRTMEASHVHLDITEAEWNATVNDFKASLAAFQVPAAEQQELLELVASTRTSIVKK